MIGDEEPGNRRTAKFVLLTETFLDRDNLSVRDVMKVILSILLAAVCAELRAKITVYSALGSRHLNGIQMISGISVDLISTMILLFSRKKTQQVLLDSFQQYARIQHFYRYFPSHQYFGQVSIYSGMLHF